MSEEFENIHEVPARNAAANLGRTILVVDDESVIADTLAAILNSTGCVATAACSGERAWEAILSRVPDLLISDICMPGMSGVELAIKVREHFPECKVLLFSGHASSAQLVEEARQLGYDFDYLTKPASPRDLLARLRCKDDRPSSLLPAA